MATVYYVDFEKRKLVSKSINDSDEIILVPDQTNLDKMNYFSTLVNEGMTTIRINTKSPDVVLPPHSMEQLTAELNWSLKFRIPDFDFDEKGVRGTLSFNKTPFYTNVPWDAVWSMALSHGGKPREWKESLPKEIFIED